MIMDNIDMGSEHLIQTANEIFIIQLLRQNEFGQVIWLETI